MINSYRKTENGKLKTEKRKDADFMIKVSVCTPPQERMEREVKN